ncbi:MAG TPA: sigma-70 family RNA polymerase sigma factor [Mucilaginibacter sp.]
MVHYSDKELLDQISLHDQQAFNTLFDRYWDKLYRIARARLDDETEAQDIVQEIFIKLWQRRETIEINTSVENYLQGAVRLSVIGHYRSLKADQAKLQNALERINILENSIHSLTDYLELEQTLEEALNLMPDMLKKVYQLRSENHSVKAIAGELGLADQTVKNYIAEVTRRLRSIIIEKYPERHLTYMAIIIAMLHK